MEMEVDEDSTEIENEMNLLNTNRRKAQIFDSDSETEEISAVNKFKNAAEEENDNEKQDEQSQNEEEEEKNIASRSKRRIILLSSDSEEENEKTVTDKQQPDNEKYTLPNINTDESVADEEEVEPHNKSFPDEKAAVYVANSKGQLVKEAITSKVSSLSALLDSESEEEIQETNEDIIPQSFEGSPKHLGRRGQRKSKLQAPKKMTAQEAAKQRSEIRAESQRMLRESNVSLPYHVPKNYTIKEFLQKRSKLPSALTAIPKAPPSVAIKMSKDQLIEVSKKLDERIKQVEELYKSDESDTEDDPTDDIRSWLNGLADKAVDSVEEKLCKLIVNTEQEIKEDDVNSAGQNEENLSIHDDIRLSETIEEETNSDEITDKRNSIRPKISELLKDKLNIQPRLSESFDHVVDLEEGVLKNSRVKQLIEKFLINSAKKVPHKHKVKMDIVGVGAGGQIVKETVSMNVDEEEEPSMVETPGAKLKRLKEELQDQMAQKRLEVWKQKREQGDILEVEKSEKKVPEEETEKGTDILDDDEEEEFEMTESESDYEDDEEEEEAQEKPTAKSAFIDNEADEDEEEIIDDEMNEDEDNNAEDENEDTNNGDNEDGEENEEDENDGDNEDEETEEFKSPKRKVLRRIIKPFSADSDDDEVVSEPNEPKKILKYYTTDEDDILPPNLPKVGKTPQKSQLDESRSEIDFLTPVTYLTGLQNLNSDSKFAKDTSSPLCVSSQTDESQTSSKKKLFDENSQETIEDLAQICSGTFATQNCDTENLPSTQDLLNLCSGDFTGVAPSSEFKEPTPVQNKSETRLEDKSDEIISQLLDEEELERFKKKFESPVNNTDQKVQIEDVQEANATGLINSDDENDTLELVKNCKKRKKLAFSDDEEEDKEDDDEEEEVEPEEEIDLQDYDDEEQQLENELVNNESRNYKISDFLDKEAELSESEWGSADEDERGLDDLEFEEGDQEKINENKMRTELERIHMRQLLDEDNREVKILQELLLDDGEMHGTGRKRQFRWRTLDSDNTDFEKREDDDIFLDEEENEEQWRKMRHKREMFLKNKVVEDEDSLLEDSQILKIGQLKVKSQSFGSQSNTTVNKSDDNSEEPFKLLLNTKKGSFLSRSDQVLQRLAEYTKVANTVVGTTAKNSKAFVFQTVEETVVRENNNKRKAAESTPNVLKKMRLDNFSPADKKSTKSSKAKKLFGNW